MKTIICFIVLTISLNHLQAQELLKGFVGERNENSENRPVVGATVYWLNSIQGTTTDTNGNFAIRYIDGSRTLVIRCIGYSPDTLVVGDRRTINILLDPEPRSVGEVKILGGRPATFLDYNNPFQKSTITEKELFKAACCNLSESFQTNPSVDVSFTDAITGTKQIEMLGLSGIYTQTTLENMPYIRGLTSNVGLTFIPGTWIDEIHVSKGIGSVANGYESVTGQIDIDLRKPEKEEESKLFLNLYGNQDQRLEANLNLRERISDRFSTMTLLHISNQKDKIDKNGDGFLDLPLFTTYNFLQRIYFTDLNGLTGQIGMQYMKDQKKGGTAAVSSPGEYLYGTNSDLLRLHGKTGYILSQDNNRSIGIQWSLSHYRASTQFGNRNYNSDERSGYLNILYQTSFAGGVHKYRTGASFLFDEYDESFENILYGRIERVPGIFFEYTFSPNEQFSVVAGIRTDKHNAYGTMVTPRLHIRYAPDENWVFRAAAGRGYRTANIFAENSPVFASSRTVVIIPTELLGYGLKQEIAWNYGLNFIHYFPLAKREASILADFYRTDFEQLVVPDLDSNPHQIIFYSVQKGSYSNSLQLELNTQLLERLDIRLAYRYLDVRQKLNGIWRERPLTSQNRVLLTVSYSTAHENPDNPQTDFNMTMQWFGKKRIPETIQNPDSMQVRSYSPAFMTMNFQITRTFLQGLDIYIGVENLMDFRQADPILDGRNPNGPFFDASLIWGPLTGRMVYAGLRFRI